MTTTWNPSDLVNITLSNGNLTAGSVTAGIGGVRSVDRLTSGKYYWEVTFNTAGITSMACGICSPSANLATVTSTSLNAAYLYRYGGTVWVNNVQVSGLTWGTNTIAAGSVIGIALDLDNKLLWFRVGAAGNWNNNAAYAPGGSGGVNIAPIFPGPPFPIYALGNTSSGNNTDNFTANFGATAFAGAVPSGYTSGFPSVGGPALLALASEVAAEQFYVGPFVNAPANLSQIALEQWVVGNPQAQVAQVAIEEWGSTSLAASTAPGAGEVDAAATVAGAGAVISPSAGEVDASATVTGAGATITIAPAAGEVDASATVTGAGAVTIPGTGEVDVAATVTGVGAVIPVVTGAGEVDAGADVTATGFIAAIGRGEVDAFADVRGMGAIIAPPGALPYLPGLGWSVHRRPTFDTIVASHPSGSEVRLALWQNCLWEFELTYDALASNAAYPGVWTDTLQTLMGFYLARGGQRGTFLFVDPDFNQMAGQGIGAGDGTTIIFPFYRVFGGQVEPVSWVTAVKAVYLDGVVTPSGWKVSGNVITFDAAPANGVVISADFSYGFLCRFLEDTLDFEEFMDNLWSLKSLKFRQVRL